jgi:hypothetical protein
MKTPSGASRGATEAYEAPSHCRNLRRFSIVYGVRALQLLHGLGITTHLVMSESAGVTLAYETAFKPADLKAIAFEVSSR